jgi:hypothetical protein
MATTTIDFVPVVVTPESSPTQMIRFHNNNARSQQLPQQRVTSSPSSSSSSHDDINSLLWSESTISVIPSVRTSPLTTTTITTTKATTNQQQQPICSSSPSPCSFSSTFTDIMAYDADIPNPDETTTDMIPESYVRLIQAAFGPDSIHHHSDATLDLYQHVLQVDRHFASPQDIRIAYFRRGRQVLADTDPTSGLPNTMTTEQIQLQFQAVSMAYEILSTPHWKRYYDQYGLPPYPRRREAATTTTTTTNKTQKNHPSSHASILSTNSSSIHTNLSAESIMLASLQQQLAGITTTPMTATSADAATPIPTAALLTSEAKSQAKKSSRRGRSTSQSSMSHGSKGTNYSSDSGVTNLTGKDNTKKKKKKRSSSRHRRSHSVGVRWHDYVEEWVFRKDDELAAAKDDEAREKQRRQARLMATKGLEDHDDHDDDDSQDDNSQDEDDDHDENDRRSPTNKESKKIKRKKHRVLVEPGDDAEHNLSNHLNRLNRETGGFMVNLLDQLEASMDQFLNLDHDDDEELDDEQVRNLLRLSNKDENKKQKNSEKKKKNPTSTTTKRNQQFVDDDNDDMDFMQDVAPLDDSRMSSPETTDAMLGLVPTTLRRKSPMNSANNSSGGGTNAVTSFLQSVTASFDEFMQMDHDEHDDDGADKIVDKYMPLESSIPTTATPSPSGKNKKSLSPRESPVVEPPSKESNDYHHDDLTTDPLLDWLQPSSIPRDSAVEEPTTIPSTVISHERKRSSSSRKRRGTTKTTAVANSNDNIELVTGPEAGWGRETVDDGSCDVVAQQPQPAAPPSSSRVSPQPLPIPSPTPPVQEQSLDQVASPPLGVSAKKGTQKKNLLEEQPSLDDGSSVLLPPPVQEVRKHNQRQRQQQHHDDDMSSLSESFAAFLWTDTPTCWMDSSRYMDDNTSFRIAPSLLASSTTNTTTLEDLTLSPVPSSSRPSTPGSTLPSILKSPKFPSTGAPQVEGFHPTNPFNNISLDTDDNYDDDPSTKGGGYSTVSNSIVSSTYTTNTNKNTTFHLPGIRITVHDDYDYGIPCTAGCSSSSGTSHLLDDARLSGQAFARSLAKYVAEMSHDLHVACCGGGEEGEGGGGEGEGGGGGGDGFCQSSVKNLMQSLTISDQDLEEWLNVLKCELDRHQVG